MSFPFLLWCWYSFHSLLLSIYILVNLFVYRYHYKLLIFSAERKKEINKKVLLSLLFILLYLFLPLYSHLTLSLCLINSISVRQIWYIFHVMEKSVDIIIIQLYLLYFFISINLLSLIFYYSFLVVNSKCI